VKTRIAHKKMKDRAVTPAFGHFFARHGGW